MTPTPGSKPTNHTNPTNPQPSSPRLSALNVPGPLPEVGAGDSRPAKQGPAHAGPSQEGDSLKESLLYKEFVAERDEILRHKWIESEKAGHDIGFEKALLDWVLRYRSAWRLQRAGGATMAGTR
jgi:hypothetical protein